MKNTFKYIIASVALAVASLSFGSTIYAQDSTVKYDKKVTPEPDGNGVYTITLDAYVTGSINESCTCRHHPGS